MYGRASHVRKVLVDRLGFCSGNPEDHKQGNFGIITPYPSRIIERDGLFHLPSREDKRNAPQFEPMAAATI